MPSPKQLEALAGFARAAVRAERLYGVPGELTTAQAIAESGWGARMPGNNCLGIKAHAGVASQEFATHECENGESKAQTCAFAAYPDLDACFEDHAILLSQRRPYDVLLTKYSQHENLPVYIEDVAKVYATDPSYAKLLLSIISMHAVQDALAAARKGAAA
jgi:flagellum-specific peptidoglycan hydrolase FlgJ